MSLSAAIPLLIAAAASAPEGFTLPTVQAAFIVGQDGELKIPKVEILAYTGVPMVIKGFKLPIVIDLDGLQSPAAVPLLKDHNPALIVGHTTAMVNDRRTLKVSGMVSGAGAVAREVIDAGKAGFPWQASVTATVLEAEEVRKGQRVSVNGRDFTGPLLIARSTRLKEISLLAMGADENTSAAIAAANLTKETAMTFEQWLQMCGITHDTNNAEQTKVLRASFEAYQATIQAGDGDADADLDREIEPTRPSSRKKAKKAKAKAKKRATPRKIKAAAAVGAEADDEDDDAPTIEAGADDDEGDEPTIEAGADDDDDEGDDAPDIQAAAEEAVLSIRRRHEAIERRCNTRPDIVARAINEGWSVRRAESEMFRQGESSAAIHTPGDRRSGQNRGRVLEAALCRTAGLSEKFLIEQYGQQTIEAADHQSLRGISVHGLTREVIRAAGMTVPGSSFNDDTIRAAFTANQRLLSAHGTISASAPTGFSTVNLSGILSNVAGKAMLESFLAVKGVAEQICKIGSVNDFKRHTRYRLTGKGGFQKVGPGGELKHHGLQNETFGVQAHTAGELLVLTREDQINDDLWALTSIAQIQGHDAAIYREELVFTLLLDNSDDFFSEENGNLLEGTDTVLSIPALQLAEALMLDQTDLNGKPVVIDPKMLLTNTADKVLAQQIFSERAITQFNDDGVARPASNPYAGQLTPLYSPYMNNAAIAGGSATAWFLFADPRRVPAIELAYLRGQRNPTIQQGETSFNTLGMAWRAFLDIGAEKQDPRGAVRVTGATAA